ncbi:MAG: EamA family transporter [Hyphomicrobiaceae bacterium]
MEQLWIWASVLAALCQALRYASLKELNQHLPAFVTSYARVLFALPILLVHLGLMLWWTGAALPAMNAAFFFYTGLTAAGQFLGTVLMMRLFRLGNFAVGTMLAKADAVMTAVIGTLLFREQISGGGWIAILVTVAGVMLTSAGRMPATAWRAGDITLTSMLFGPATRLGLVIALVNALAFLALREAILALGGKGGVALDAAVAGTVMTLLSCVFLGAYLLATDRPNLMRIGSHVRLCSVVGLASAFGTLLWFLATALANASYVAAVAQVQIVFALALSRYWFLESITRLELVGIAIILAGIMLFRLA